MFPVKNAAAFCLQRYVTVSDIPVDNCHLKDKVSKAFKNLQEDEKLNLKSLKISHLIDFISTIPKMTPKAVTRNITIH